jgi:hypothetical protein
LSIETEGSGSSEPITDASVTVTETVSSDDPFLVEIAQDETILVLPKLPVVDNEKESVSIDASDYFRAGDFLPFAQEPDNNIRSFVFPKIDVPDLPRRRQDRAVIPEAIPVPPTIPSEDRSVVIEQLPGEPAIIFKQPKRFHKIASTRYTLN